MCVDPATITAVASVAGAGMSILGKTSQYQDNSALYIENIKNTNRALAQSYNSAQTRTTQEADKEATQNFDIVRGMAEAKGKATAAAGEAGVEGVSFANVLSDYESREGRARASNDANYQMVAGQVQNEMESSRTRAKANILATPAPSETGLYAGIGADLFKAGLKVYEAFDPKSNKGGPSSKG